MYRARIVAPKGKVVAYTHLDVVKDAATNMLAAAGCSHGELHGEGSLRWSLAPIMKTYTAPCAGEKPSRRTVSSFVISTVDEKAADLIRRADTSMMVKHQPLTGEAVDLSGWRIYPEPAPVIPNLTTSIEAVSITPLLVSYSPEGQELKRRSWHVSVRDFNVSEVISARLSKLAGRQVSLTVTPDDLYLAGRRKHSALVDIRVNKGKSVFMKGMVFPFILAGSSEDLALAWYAGLGDRTRMGFGFFGEAA